MTIIDDHTITGPRVGRIGSTSAADDRSLASSDRDLRTWRDGWQRIIDTYLVEWGRNPGVFDAEEIDPPSEEIIHLANKVALTLRDAGWPAPLRVVPDGDGGIVFERHVNEVFESLEILEDGSVELATFRNCRLYARNRIA